MGSTRPLRDAFNEVSGSAGQAGTAGPEQVLRAAGHPDLPGELLGEAVVNYADSAPPEVAEHLAPLVMAHTGIVAHARNVGEIDPEQWLDRLATAPELGTDPQMRVDHDLDDIPAGPIVDSHLDQEAGGSFEDLSDQDGGLFTDPVDLDFGQGDASAVPGVGEPGPGGAYPTDASFEDASGDGDDPTGPWDMGPAGQNPVETPSQPSAEADGLASADPFFDDLLGQTGPESTPGDQPPAAG